MNRQALLLLCTLSLTPACVLNLEVLDGVADDVGDSEETDVGTGTDEGMTEAESSTSSTDDSATTETSTTATDESSSSTTDAETSTSTTFGDTGTSDAPPDCAEIEIEYDQIVTMTDCMVDSDCKIISGHCSVGLGGCYYAVNSSADEAFLDTLAQLWSNGGCTQGVCDCAEPPASAICDAGTCVGVP